MCNEDDCAINALCISVNSQVHASMKKCMDQECMHKCMQLMHVLYIKIYIYLTVYYRFASIRSSKIGCEKQGPLLRKPYRQFYRRQCCFYGYLTPRCMHVHNHIYIVYKCKQSEHCTHDSECLLLIVFIFKNKRKSFRSKTMIYSV